MRGELNYGVILWLTFAAGGLCMAQRAATPATCAALKIQGKKAEATGCFQTLTRSSHAYLRAEGFWGLQQYDDANAAFRDAVANSGGLKASEQAHERVRWGMLLHERFNNKEADELFLEALKLDASSAEAYLGTAMVSAEGFDSKAEEYAAKALTLDPKMVEAHEFMANLALESQKTAIAVAEADQALALSGEALEALAVHAAVDVLADKRPDIWFNKIAAVNPGYGEAYALVGYHLVLNRRYQEGVAFYRKAIAMSPELWAARSQLGINLMRLGQEEEPLQQLELAYNHGQRDAATVNSLRLLDTYKNFVATNSSAEGVNTRLKLHKNEEALLRPYFQRELNKAIATYKTKYNMTLPGPVQVEVYPDHEDFAVRTMGMPGLGALGVTFGEVVAMDSPSGRKPGEFNWGSTLWHEMSHVFILAATNHRVPRWFAEGLAVHEEGTAKPEWATRPTPEILIAMRGKKLLPVTTIDQGFIYPEYPAQVIVSYFQAGAMCDYIQQLWGEDKLLEMVHSFAALETTPEVIQTALHISPSEFDLDFGSWLEKKYGQDVANFDRWRKGLGEVVKAGQAGQNEEVIAKAPAVLKLYPEYVGEANAYEFLAQAQIARGDKAGAATTLTTYQKMGGMSPSILDKLADLQQDLGQAQAGRGYIG